MSAAAQGLSLRAEYSSTIVFKHTVSSKYRYHSARHPRHPLRFTPSPCPMGHTVPFDPSSTSLSLDPSRRASRAISRLSSQLRSDPTHTHTVAWHTQLSLQGHTHQGTIAAYSRDHCLGPLLPTRRAAERRGTPGRLASPSRKQSLRRSRAAFRRGAQSPSPTPPCVRPQRAGGGP